LTSAKTLSWKFLFIFLGLMVVLNVILAIVVAARVDRLVLVEGTTDIYRSLPYTLGDYVLFASLAIVFLAFLATILMMVFKPFADLLFASIASFTIGFPKAVNSGSMLWKRMSNRKLKDDSCDSHPEKQSA
jgi:hypothetical protein